MKLISTDQAKIILEHIEHLAAVAKITKLDRDFDRLIDLINCHISSLEDRAIFDTEKDIA